MDKELGNRIKQLRQQADLTQSQLARVLNVSPALISAYELGDRKPSLEILVSLAATFKVSTDFLLGVRNPPPCSMDGLSPEEIQAVEIILHGLRRKSI